MSETLVVAKMVEGKFGPQVLDVAGNYYSFSQKYNGDTVFQPGTKLEADVYVSEKGKYKNRYLNSVKVVGTEAVDTAKGVDLRNAPPKKSFKAKEDTSMSKAEWAAKDRSQLIGGLSHDAATLAATLYSVDGSQLGPNVALQLYKQLLDGMLKIREEIK